MPIIMELILGMLQAEGYDARPMCQDTSYPKITIYRQDGTWGLLIGVFIRPNYPSIMINLDVVYRGDVNDDVLCDPDFEVEPVLNTVLNAIKRTTL